MTLHPLSGSGVLRFAWLLPLALFCSCLDPVAGDRYISLKVEDSLTAFQKVHIVLMESDLGGDTVDVLWDGPLPDPGKLRKVKVSGYKGGDAVVVIRAFDDGELLYMRRIKYRDSDGMAEVDTPAFADLTPPTFKVHRTDTVEIVSWDKLPESLVSCTDRRDGALQAMALEPIRLSDPEIYLVTFRCQDRSGNRSAQGQVTVRIKGRHGTRIPKITLLGRDSLDIPQDSHYADSGANCQDDVKGNLAVTVEGKVDTATWGEYILTYSCKDGEGNAAVSRRRMVRVSGLVDYAAPVITLYGPDSLDHVMGSAYVDSPAVCMDLRDGVRPIMSGGAVNVRTLPGRYELTYSCKDLTGNQSTTLKRIVRVVRVATFHALAETAMDTTLMAFPANNGLNPALTFGKMTPFTDPWATILAFDLDLANKDSLKSAKVIFHTYISGPYTPVESLKVVFLVHRVRKPWVEGTGNGYYNRGGYQNNGAWFLQNHPFRPEIAEKSTDPVFSSGLTKAGREILRISDMDEAGSDTLVLTYQFENFSNDHPGILPTKMNLVKVEIDLKRYVLETPTGMDYGLVITTQGMPTNIWITWATKELGDGTMGPQLKLTY